MTDATYRVVRARSFELVDDDDNLRGELSTDGDISHLASFRRDGSPSFLLVGGEDSVTLRFCGPDLEAEPRLELAIDRSDQANAMIAMRGAGGTLQFAVEVGGDGSTYLHLGDETDADALTLSGWPSAVEESRHEAKEANARLVRILKRVLELTGVGSPGSTEDDADL